MLSRLLAIAVFISVQAVHATAQESSVRSTFTDTTSLAFFPHQVGDLWHWWHSAYGHITTAITRDSLGPNGSHFLFYDNDTDPKYEVDTACQVFGAPSYPGRYLLYKLDADSGTIWQKHGMWAWCAKVGYMVVFGRISPVKLFRYSYGYPDSAHANQYLEEHYLASGVGLLAWDGEPAWIEELWGCIISGDTLGTITSVEPAPRPMPTSFCLQQNYPNPFNPTTTIQYALPHRSHVTLIIYSPLGQQVATLINGEIEAGSHSVQFEAKNLASGVYFYRLRAGDFVQSKKLLLVK